MAKRNKEVLKEEDKRALNKANLKKLTGIFRFMKPHLGLFTLGFVALIISTLTLLAFPKLAGELVDVAEGDSRYFTDVYQVAMVLMAVLFFQAIFGFIRVYTFSIVSERGIASLRKEIYQKYIWSPIGFFDNRRVGELMSRITADVATLQDTFSLTIAELFRQIVMVLGGTCILFLMAPNLIHVAYIPGADHRCAGVWKIHPKTFQKYAG
jgi:ATP-binding cassette, subfamily B, bacterial